MLKAKKYDWKDSNMALFGSDTEKKVKKESAESEPAWKGAGSEVGLQIWRIVKFKVTDWPKEEYGQFYNGDSYIILNTYKDPDGDSLLYDVHFWIGKYSTQDEYGTAAYKTVELDTFLDDLPVQHREVQGHESTLFKSYFDSLTLLKGGADTGFRRVTPEQYAPRLHKVCGERKNITVTEIPCKRGNVNSEDVFILDLGLTIYQFNGSTANKDEKFKATQYLQQLKSDRSGKAKVETLDEDSIDSDHPFYKNLKDGTSKKRDEKAGDMTKELYKVSDASGKLEFSEEKKGDIAKSDLDSADVFILDTKNELFVWVGKGASTDERRNAMTYAHKYLSGTDHAFLPVSCVAEGGRPVKEFEAALAA